MSGDGSQLLSVDSNSGRIIHQDFWDTDFRTKDQGSTDQLNNRLNDAQIPVKVFEKELPPTNYNLVLDMTRLELVIEGINYANRSLAPAAHQKQPNDALCVQVRVPRTRFLFK